MSRLLRIIILSVSLVGALAPACPAQTPWSALDVTKQQYRKLRKQVNKIPLAGQFAEFNLGTNTRIKLAKLDTVKQIGHYPLPSRLALDKAGMAYPDFLAELLGADYLVDIEGQSAAGFFGLDSAGRVLRATAYPSGRDPGPALLSHDFLLPGTDELPGAGKLKVIKKELQQKLIEYFARATALPTTRQNRDILQKNFNDWVIKVYAANKDIHTLKNSAAGPLPASLPLPDDNWLSRLLAKQILQGGFNERGQRQRLVDGRARMFSIDTLKWPAVDSLMTLAIRQKATPGGQLLVAKDGYVVLEKAFGYQTYDSLLPIHEHTLYDLASLTKVLATTQALMLLFDEGKFDPERKLAEYLPYLEATNKAEITGTEVLSHQANLYLYYPFWRKALENFDLAQMQGSNRVGSKLAVDHWVSDSIVHWAAESALLTERIDTITRKQYFYSDIGFFFLKDLVEKQSGQALDDYLNDNLYQPNQIGLLFNPLSFYADTVIAPTEFDRFLRNELVRGYVHDRNAALLGGVAGQAGLFGNARAIAELMQIQLDKGRRAGQQVFSEKVIKEFTTRHFANNRRGLGWDMPALPAVLAGGTAGRPGPEPDGPVSAYASAGTFGHTGFTGGMVWADPQENLIFVFLSNRVYPSADNNKLVELNIRTRIQDIIYQSLGYQ